MPTPRNPFAAITDSPIRRRPSVPLFPWALWAALFIGNGVVAVLLSDPHAHWVRLVQQEFMGKEPLVYSGAFLLNLYCIPRLWSRP